MDSPYRFDELGWVLFERLCDGVLEQVLGVERDGWLGRADAGDRVAVVEAVAIDGVAVPAPCLVLVAWCPTMPSVSDRGVTAWVSETLVPVVLREAAAREGRVASLLVVSDVELSAGEWGVEGAGREALAGLGVPVRTVGPRWLGSILDADAVLRRRLPFALGVREIDLGLGAGSAFDLEAAARLARVFVPTQAYARALEVVERHRFAVLTGPPEMGKTAIARMLALACLTDGWQVVECAVPDDLWRAYDRDRRQVFVVDDAFGSTEYRPEAADRWALELDRVLRSTDEQHWLLWTSRPAPFQAGLRRIRREHGVERFPRPAEVAVDASELTVEEKALMLLRHARRNGTQGTSSLVRANGWSIVSHPHFTPERIRRFAGTHLPALRRRAMKPLDVRRAIEREIREPTEGMRASLAALDAEQAAILVSLLDVPPGATPLRTLAAAVRRHSTGGGEGTLELSVAGLLDHFLRQTDDGSVAWVHPSWRDLIVDEIAGSAERRARFLRAAGLDGLLLAISTAGGAGERVFPFMVDDADWDELTGRLSAHAGSCTEPELNRILLAVAEAIGHAPGDREIAETEALTRTLLERLRDRWNDQTAVPLPQLELWFRLNAAIPIALDPPALDRAWFELLPTTSLDLTDPTDLQLLDDWLTLAAILREHARALLQRYGYPEAHTPVLESLLAEARWHAFDDALTDPVRERLAGVLRRAGTFGLLRVAKTVAAFQTADRLEQTDERWFELRLDPGKPSRASTAHDRGLVDRILSDL